MSSRLGRPAGHFILLFQQHVAMLFPARRRALPGAESSDSTLFLPFRVAHL
jgi:hypothetical protein